MSSESENPIADPVVTEASAGAFVSLLQGDRAINAFAAGALGAGSLLTASDEAVAALLRAVADRLAPSVTPETVAAEVAEVATGRWFHRKANGTRPEGWFAVANVEIEYRHDLGSTPWRFEFWSEECAVRSVHAATLPELRAEALEAAAAMPAERPEPEAPAERPAAPGLDGGTLVCVTVGEDGHARDDGYGRVVPLRDFLADNFDGLSAAEVTELHSALGRREPWRHGGGAAPLVTVTLAAAVDAAEVA
jgi:hypothetical protein